MLIDFCPTKTQIVGQIQKINYSHIDFRFWRNLIQTERVSNSYCVSESASLSTSLSLFCRISSRKFVSFSNMDSIPCAHFLLFLLFLTYWIRICVQDLILREIHFFTFLFSASDVIEFPCLHFNGIEPLNSWPLRCIFRSYNPCYIV